MRKAHVLIALVIMTTVTTIAQPKKVQPVSVQTLIDDLCSKLDRYYIFPDKSQIIIAHLKQRLKSGAYRNATSNLDLANKIASDIQSVHHDSHMNVSYDPELSKELLNPGPPPKQDPKSLTPAQQARENNFGFIRSDILDGNVGYVKFSEFSPFIKEAMPTLNAAFEFVSHTNAVIVDLRENGGGNPWMVAQISSYFVKERTRLNDIYERDGDRTMEFFADPADADHITLLQPLYILTSKQTFSAAEDFTYAMQVNKRALIVGDTTGGGAHPTRSVSVGQGFTARIPYARSINHITKTDWEGTGVRPDIAVTGDKALQEAQLHYLKGIANTSDWGQKLKTNWAINYLKMPVTPLGFDRSKLEAYCGQFEDFKFSIRDNKFYCEGRNGQNFYPTLIEGDLFLGLSWLQLEFVRDQVGNVSKLKLLGKPGWEEVLARSK